MPPSLGSGRVQAALQGGRCMLASTRPQGCLTSRPPCACCRQGRGPPWRSAQKSGCSCPQAAAARRAARARARRRAEKQSAQKAKKRAAAHAGAPPCTPAPVQSPGCTPGQMQSRWPAPQDGDALPLQAHILRPSPPRPTPPQTHRVQRSDIGAPPSPGPTSSAGRGRRRTWPGPRVRKAREVTTARAQPSALASTSAPSKGSASVPRSGPSACNEGDDMPDLATAGRARPATEAALRSSGHQSFSSALRTAAVHVRTACGGQDGAAAGKGGPGASTRRPGRRTCCVKDSSQRQRFFTCMGIAAVPLTRSFRQGHASRGSCRSHVRGTFKGAAGRVCVRECK